MSWSSFANLIMTNNKSIDDWMSAIKGNPNTPAAALKVALMHFVSCGDVTSLDDFCEFVVALVDRVDTYIQMDIETDTMGGE